MLGLTLKKLEIILKMCDIKIFMYALSCIYIYREREGEIDIDIDIDIDI